MKGTVIRGTDKDLLVRTDRGATVVVELTDHFYGLYESVKWDDYPNVRELLSVWCDREWTQREKNGLISGGVPVVQGDRISYEKKGPGQYVICKIFCKSSDPRAVSELVQVVGS